MSIFDKLKPTPTPAAAPVQTVGQPKQAFTFAALPESLAQMQALPEAKRTDPFQTAALSVCALCAYAADKQIGKEMLNWLLWDQFLPVSIRPPKSADPWA